MAKLYVKGLTEAEWQALRRLIVDGEATLDPASAITVPVQAPRRAGQRPPPVKLLAGVFTFTKVIDNPGTVTDTPDWIRVETDPPQWLADHPAVTVVAR